jgi:hypothetical protein
MGDIVPAGKEAADVFVLTISLRATHLIFSIGW